MSIKSLRRDCGALGINLLDNFLTISFIEIRISLRSMSFVTKPSFNLEPAIFALNALRATSLIVN